MKAKINTGGTHIQHGFLKVMVELYPDLIDKCYAEYNLEFLNRVPTEVELNLYSPEKLRMLIGTHKELVPCHRHFIKVNDNSTLEEIRNYILQIFDGETVLNIDNAKSMGKRARPFLKNKVGFGSTSSIKDAVKKMNKKIANLEIEIG